MDPNARPSVVGQRAVPPERPGQPQGAVPPQRPEAPRRAEAPRPANAIQVGPLLVTPVRAVLVLAVVGSLAYLAFALSVRDTSQLPLLSSGAAVLGIAFMALAVSGFLGIRQAGYEGRDGRAVGLALLGGLAAIIGFGAFAMAIVLAMEA